jgi:hypothetical protein
MYRIYNNMTIKTVQLRNILKISRFVDCDRNVSEAPYGQKFPPKRRIHVQRCGHLKSRVLIAMLMAAH